MPTVLVVEDDLSVQEMVVKVLTKNGFKAIAVASHDEAEAVIASGEALEIAVVDYWLGDRDAIPLIALIKQTRPTTSVVGVSGGGGGVPLETSTALAEAAGADEFLYKPFTIEELLTALDRLIGGDAED